MNINNKPSAPKSGAKAGVADGLSMVESLSMGEPQAQQKFSGDNLRQTPVKESAGSSKGKSFTFSN